MRLRKSAATALTLLLITCAAVVVPGAASASPADEAKQAAFAKLRTEGFRLVAPRSHHASNRVAAEVAAPPVLNWPFRIRNVHSNKCLTIFWASQADNAQAIQYTCDNTYPYNEYWTFILAGYDIDGLATYHMVNNHSSKCLTIYGVSLANNANAVQYTCENTAPFNERWYVWFQEYANTYMFVNVHSGLCLTVYYVSTGDEAPVVQYACEFNSPYNERWRIVD
jgi:hypothetical protein